MEDDVGRADSPNRIESATGANPRRWLERVKSFVEADSDERHRMLEKLRALLVIKMHTMLDKEPLTPTEVERSEIDEDASGVTTYKNYSPFGREDNPCVGVSLLPQGVSLDVAVSDRTPNSCGNLARRVALTDNSKYQFFVKGAIDIIKNRIKENAYGLVVDGREVKPFVSKSAYRTNEQESGGVLMRDGEFEIVEYSELVQKAHDADRAEQTVFVMDNSNWQKLASLPSYKNRLIDNVYVGYFWDENDDKQYFAACSTLLGGSQNGIVDTAALLNRISEEKGFLGWKAACMDVGLVFAGMAYKSSPDGDDMTFVGPTAKPNKDGFYYNGGLSMNTLNFSWERSRQ